MRIEQTSIQKNKAWIHCAQAAVTFIAGCLALGIITKPGTIGGKVGFYFALCILSIPAIIYQCLVPIYERAWRFANVYAYLALDFSFALLWFSAFIAVAKWDAGGENKAGDTNKGCANWAFGGPVRCQISRASAGIGAVLFLLWCLTTAVSANMVWKFRRDGVMPGTARQRARLQSVKLDDPNKDAWSAKIDERDDSFEMDEERRRYGQTAEDDEPGSVGLLHRGNQSQQDVHTEDGLHPGRPLSYGSPPQTANEPSSYDSNAAPSALSPTGEHDARHLSFGQPRSGERQDGRFGFPAANYGA